MPVAIFLKMTPQSMCSYYKIFWSPFSECCFNI